MADATRPPTISDDEIIVVALNRYADSCGTAAYNPTRYGPNATELRRRAARARTLAAAYKESLPGAATRARTGP